MNETAALLILRAALPSIRRERCDFIRAAAFELLAKISPQAEAEQLVITAAAVRRSGEAQMLMEECIANAATAPAWEDPTKIAHDSEG